MNSQVRIILIQINVDVCKLTILSMNFKVKIK